MSGAHARGSTQFGRYRLGAAIGSRGTAVTSVATTLPPSRKAAGSGAA